MWHIISNDSDLASFMNIVYSFHDSCIKEMKYLSGAYVNDELSMYPINDRRILKVIVQRQFQGHAMIEMEFEGLQHLQLSPCNDEYTCEILDATMIFVDDYIYWCDNGGITEPDLQNYNGTIICASKFRWRSIDNCMGDSEFYLSKV